ncbi:MAG: preprotein translocase subunit YajC [Acidobacteria bacterium]|nr:preprotein translocase subunit YajC [Acidobacteriota bacterium]
MAFLLQSQNPILGFLPVLLIFAIFYFLLFLPMQKQKKQTKQMLETLKNGDEIVTNGGLIGSISAINTDNDTVVLRLKPDGVKVLIARSAVAGMMGAKPETQG